MTNLQQGQAENASQSVLERWLLLGPALTGAVLAVGAAFGLGWPIWQDVQKEQAQVDSLRQLEQQLPLLRRQLAVEREQSEKAALQRQTLQQLIAGSGTLATFMAQVDRLAAASGVRLDLYEPQLPPPPPPPSEDSARAPGRDGEAAAAPPPDPLVAEGLEKRILLLKATGKYPKLLTFLRQLETLSVLVSQSDLNLTLEEVKGPEPAAPSTTQAAQGQPAPARPVSVKTPPKSQVVLRMGVTLYENAPDANAVKPVTPTAPRP